MSKETKIAQRFLEGINKESTKSTFGELFTLIETLESKEDPDPVEVRIVESLYHFLEKLKVLEHNLKSYVIEDNSNNLIGNKLNNLYESSKGYGTSSLFN